MTYENCTAHQTFLLGCPDQDVALEGIRYCNSRVGQRICALIQLNREQKLSAPAQHERIPCL